MQKKTSRIICWVWRRWEVLCYEKPMRLVPIQRVAASYHSEQFKHPTIASATAIRQGLKQGEAVVDFVPEATQKFLSQKTVDWEAFWPYLQYQIISAPLEKLAAIYQMEEGLEYRLKQYVTAADSFADFIKLLKTKRYTQTRLQRLACYVLFQVTKAEMKGSPSTSFYSSLRLYEARAAIFKRSQKRADPAADR